jgi:flotillin
VRLAASNFLGMSVEEIRDALTKVVSGHLRTIVAGLSVVDLYTDQARFTEDLKAKAADELQSLGYSFLSFVFESITDENGYLDALGVPEIERARRDARIAQADNDRDASLEEEDARLTKERGASASRPRWRTRSGSCRCARRRSRRRSTSPTPGR